MSLYLMVGEEFKDIYSVKNISNYLGQKVRGKFRDAAVKTHSGVKNNAG